MSVARGGRSSIVPFRLMYQVHAQAEPDHHAMIVNNMNNMQCTYMVPGARGAARTCTLTV